MSVASNGGTKFFCDLRGVRYYAPLRVLELGVIMLDGERCLRLSWETASDANNGGLLVRALEDNMKRIVQGEVLRTLRRRNRKYKIVLHFWVLYWGLYQWTAHIVVRGSPLTTSAVTCGQGVLTRTGHHG